MMSRMQDKIKKQNINASDSDTAMMCAGIDVGKDNLDVYITADGTPFRVGNNKAEIKRLIQRLRKAGVILAALEATSKYHRLAHKMLHEAGIKVAVVNPFRSRQFADSLGRLAKTDGIDAHSLALFAARMKPKCKAPPSAEHSALRDLQAARRQVVDEVSDLKRQLHTTEHALAKRQIKARIAMGSRHRKALEAEITALIKSDEILRHKHEILTSIPGIGKITASILLSELSELGHANAKEIAALAGVAPMNWDSGAKQGSRIIRGGRRTVRNALYMCAVVCSRMRNDVGRTYHHLIERGKYPKVALTAVMRKLIILANTLIAEDRKWQPHKPSQV